MGGDAAEMVKCRNHPYEQGVGVCASCLRERLLALIAAQSGRPQHCCSGTPVQQGPPLPFQLKQTPPPPPLVFPRSVSPYVSHRRSVDPDFPPDADDRCHRRQPVRFHSTPQVGPVAGRKKGAGAAFSIFSSLFGGGGQQFRSEDAEQGSGASTAAARSGSWFAALISGRSKKKNKDSKHFESGTAEEDSVTRRRKRRACRRDRGMSPVGDESGGEDGSEPGSGYSTDSPNEWRRPGPTPLRKPSPSVHRAMSGFGVCLSPLVRASPRRSQAGDGAGGAGPPLQPRGALGVGRHCRRRHHQRQASGLGGPPSLGPNRSRKLVDLGRFR